MAHEPTLRQGDTGEYVSSAQQWLAHGGFYRGAVDGQYGESTVQAVQALQQSTGLPVTGELDDQTWRVLLGESVGHTDHDSGHNQAEDHSNGAHEHEHAHADHLDLDPDEFPELKLILEHFEHGDQGLDAYLAAIGCPRHEVTDHEQAQA